MTVDQMTDDELTWEINRVQTLEAFLHCHCPGTRVFSYFGVVEPTHDCWGRGGRYQYRLEATGFQELVSPLKKLSVDRTRCLLKKRELN